MIDSKDHTIYYCNLFAKKLFKPTFEGIEFDNAKSLAYTRDTKTMVFIGEDNEGETMLVVAKALQRIVIVKMCMS